MKTVRGTWLAVCLVACAVALIALVGCAGGGQGSSGSSASASEASTSAAVQESEPSGPEYAVEIGSESDDALSIVVENDLGKGISDIAFSAAGSADAPAYLMATGQEWLDGEGALVHFSGVDGATAYDVYVHTEDADYVLHSIDLASVDELELRLEGDIAYATYELDGSLVSSLQQEVELAERAAAEAQAAAEAEAQAAAEAEAAAQAQYSYDYGSSGNGGSGGASGGGSAPAQGEQGCVDGGVKLR